MKNLMNYGVIVPCSATERRVPANQEQNTAPVAGWCANSDPGGVRT